MPPQSQDRASTTKPRKGTTYVVTTSGRRFPEASHELSEREIEKKYGDLLNRALVLMSEDPHTLAEMMELASRAEKNKRIECAAGHKLTSDNLVVTPRSAGCKICAQERSHLPKKQWFCSKGHAMTEGNVALHDYGRIRMCRKCLDRRREEKAEARRAKLEEAKARRDGIKTCKRGHPRTPENLMKNGKGWTCKPCREASYKAKLDRLRLKSAERKGDPTKCQRGHLWTPENTYTAPSGRRACKACQALMRAKQELGRT